MDGDEVRVASRFSYHDREGERRLSSIDFRKWRLGHDTMYIRNAFQAFSQVRGIGSCGRNKTKPMSEIVQGEPEISTPIRFPLRLRPT